ncbi:unnamed protein product, partial [Amoebophrya sp. A120]|eukprot:GSA120T00007783001.1
MMSDDDYCSEVPHFRRYLPYPSLLLNSTEDTSINELERQLLPTEAARKVFRRLLQALYKPQKLSALFAKRAEDRHFVDTMTKHCFEKNQANLLRKNKSTRIFSDTREAGVVNDDSSSYGRFHDWVDKEYPTVLGKQDLSGRVVVGTTRESSSSTSKATTSSPTTQIASKGKKAVVTYFAPSTTAKISADAMNCLQLSALAGSGEQIPESIKAKLDSKQYEVMWGADCED